jgi:hypothetical protein
VGRRTQAGGRVCMHTQKKRTARLSDRLLGSWWRCSFYDLVSLTFQYLSYLHGTSGEGNIFIVCATTINTTLLAI